MKTRWFLLENVLIFIVIAAYWAFAPSPKKYALLVGIDKYDDAAISSLEFSEADATALGDFFKSAGYDVELLLGSKATQSAIRKRLRRLQSKGKTDGIVIVGLFGHGVEMPQSDSSDPTVQNNPNQALTQGYFCPVDTKARAVRGSTGKPGLNDNGQPMIEPHPATLITIAELLNSLKMARADSRVVFADCCHKIQNADRVSGFGGSLEAVNLPEDTAFFVASSPDQISYGNRDWGHGAFTQCLLEELSKLSNEDTATSAVLGLRLMIHLPRFVFSVAPNQLQTPVLFSKNNIDFQLKPPPTSNPPPAPASTSAPPLVTTELTSDEMKISREFDGTQSGDRKELALGMAFRWCPEGKFVMGSPKSEEDRGDDENQVNVTLTTGFWLGETEVTQGQAIALMQGGPWQDEDGVKTGDDYAASFVSFHDARAFCEKLTNQEHETNRLPADWSYSLPTEAQWEYACRAGSTTRYCFGNADSQLSEYAWYRPESNESSGVREPCARQVGQKKPNSWGLLDMHGNVWEWCRDWHTEKYFGGQDPQGAASGTDRVMRGGAWATTSTICRSAQRNNIDPTHRSRLIGFRLAVITSRK